MHLEKFKGIFPALLTPMLEDDSIDFESLERFVKHLLSLGVKGFYVGGSTAEGFILTSEERKRILETVVGASAGQATVIAHIGAISTRESCELARHAEAAGADAISAVVPFYYKVSPEGIRQHYHSIMDSTSLPFIMYHFPGATGVSLPLDFYEAMAQHPRCIGVKFTSLNLFELQQIRARCGDDFLIYNGHDEVYAGGALSGADGAIGSTFNMMPQPFLQMFDHAARGDWSAVMPLQAQANEVISHLLAYDVIPYEKMICYLQGLFRTPKARQPLSQFDAEQKAAIEQYFNSSAVLQANSLSKLPG
ncbi:dihydrodipicolinate synthase family protein [Paenibacillus koleovorans]|uniref:dihydrodipicolinate synthase family protein n=1 Tax=Paenibacillus koleovorans TaxID=121608 RepID=UPI000FD72E91|nr:dihydrodipicolinate synthase family protein [Paenibacillus koleovorans]